MYTNYGMKELYDVSIRLNNPIECGGRKFSINETILRFDTIELSNLTEVKVDKAATGGYHNNTLINWEVDKEMDFAVSNGILSPVSWGLLSNSKIIEKKEKSVFCSEVLQTIEDDKYCYVDLKFPPNHCGRIGIQGNPNNEPLPMGRRLELELKPLPPSKTNFIFCYDVENGKKIENFSIIKNRIFLDKGYRKVMVDYTFCFKGNIHTIEVGNRLFGGFLNLSGKMSVKDEKSGEVSTAIMEMPKIKIASTLSIGLGKDVQGGAVSDFFFKAYPDENTRREKQSTCKITFLDKELTGDYI